MEKTPGRQKIDSRPEALHCWQIQAGVYRNADHQGGGKPVHIKMTLFGLYLIQYQPHLSIFESF
jgi:hypothetical protein